MPATKRRSFEVTGQVIDRKTRRGFARLRVEAWEDDLITSSITDARGRFHLNFEGDKHPDLFFKLFKLNQLLKSTSDSAITPGQQKAIDVQVVKWSGGFTSGGKPIKHPRRWNIKADANNQVLEVNKNNNGAICYTYN